MNYYIGIDIGSSSAKMLLIDSEGSIVSSVSRAYSVTEIRHGWKEIDPELWVNAVDDGMEELLSSTDRKLVRGIGVTGQMHTVIMLDESGRSIRPALMWNDIRTADLVPDVKKEIAQLPELNYINKILSTGSPAINLLWVKKNEPENFKKIKKFLIGPDYIVYRLTGQVQTDYCEASTSSLYDLKKGEWSLQIRNLLEFPEEIYPPVKGAEETAGTLLPYFQQKYGLSPEVKVIVGTGDNPAAAVVTGCFKKEYPVMSFGTSGVLMFPRKELDFNAKGKNILFSVDGKTKAVLVQGVIQSCGSTLSWWMEKIQSTRDYDGEIKKADPQHLGENNLIFYPHLNGDKTIYADPKLKGGFLGIGTETTKTDMVIAVLEGLCFGVRQLTETMKISREQLMNLRVTGGGAKDEIWMQILADVLDVPVTQMESTAGAGYGVAMLAAENDGADIEGILAKTAVEKKKIYPQQQKVELYNRKYHTYCRVCTFMKELYEM